ncbi:hypothetical protein ACILFQ_05900 [Capnocytophaga canimorsus]|uniref:hypothetical protein n=1 Tax=Capnocytophaga canimorsus TaxID=28188 RepID=UPI0005896FAA|nr:hypothetical protein [Capnocytophaga canimorsus]CEN47509.1 conserved hypothetical protein [Capnocytophaga canimorsus]VEJ18443.1 Uncharacterised protein [Capnocytophaga canimorsus]
MKEFRKVLIYIDSILLPKGFKLFESQESGCIICDYRKSTNQSINSIAFLKREDKIKGFYYAVNFIEMELIIIPILTKNKLFGDVKPENIDESFWVQKNTRYTLSDDGKDISKYEEVVNIFNLFYKEEALPFFEKWKDLNVLYEYIKDKTEDELWEILGQFAPMKKAVILRLCNDSNYQSFMDNYFQKQKEYFEEDPEDIDNIRYYNVAKELKEILDKTEPIYNL